jgi:hypothetical protein
MEAIHWRDGSDHGLIDGCNIRSTGKVDPGKGEGIYIGSSRGAWGDFDHHVTHVTIRNCILGPIIRSEAIDVKEGTEHITIENNTFDATGLSNQNFADSFIDLKGARAIVRYNIFRRNGETNLLKGINVIDRDVEFSGYDHVIHDNDFDLDRTGLMMVIANGGTSGVYAWNNHGEQLGDEYSSSVITNSIPPWYSPPVQQTPSSPPVQQTPSSPPVQQTPSGVMVYDDGLRAGWTDESVDGIFNFGYSEGTSSSTHIRAEFTDTYGSVRLMYYDGLDTTGLTSLRFRMKAEDPTDGFHFRVKLNAARLWVDTPPNNVWTTVTLPLTDFGNPAIIEKVILQNRCACAETMYFDSIEFI